ncbi:hypothetical protein HKL94_01980 [Candidatus Parcubacteria bacterium]|nr:hypothetical protein [Candidatus Parcubacteria bacterium]
MTEKEAIVYLVAIESGISTAPQLSANSKINRSSVYMVLGSLIEKGLLKQSRNAAGVSTFEAFEPDVLLDKAAEMKQRQSEIRRNIDELIPDLNALSPSLALHPRVKFYEGRGGIETAIHDLSISGPGEIVRGFMAKPIITYRKSGQLTRIISPYTGGALTMSKDKSVTVCLVPSKQYTFSSDIRIYADKVVLISEREEFAAIIENKHFAEVMKETFDLAWEEARRLDIRIRAATKRQVES